MTDVTGGDGDGDADCERALKSTGVSHLSVWPMVAMDDIWAIMRGEGEGGQGTVRSFRKRAGQPKFAGAGWRPGTDAMKMARTLEKS